MRRMRRRNLKEKNRNMNSKSQKTQQRLRYLLVECVREQNLMREMILRLTSKVNGMYATLNEETK